MSLSTELPPPWIGPSGELLASQTTKSESICCQLVPGPALSHLIVGHRLNRSSAASSTAMGAPLLLGIGPRRQDWLAQLVGPGQELAKCNNALYHFHSELIQIHFRYGSNFRKL
jgi:hypothetical protein